MGPARPAFEPFREAQAEHFDRGYDQFHSTRGYCDASAAHRGDVEATPRLAPRSSRCSQHGGRNVDSLVPAVGIEPTTNGLQIGR